MTTMPSHADVVRRFAQDFLGRADLAAADATAHPRIRASRASPA